MPADPPPIALRSIAGPHAAELSVKAPRSGTIGRAAECDLCLLDDSVSRHHASILSRSGAWYILHRSLRSATALNGVPIIAGKAAALATGDLLQIGPYTLRVTVGEGLSTDRPASTVDEPGVGLVTQFAPRDPRAPGQGGGSRADRRLNLLIRAMTPLPTQDIQHDEEALARTILQTALEGSGYARAAALRRIEDSGVGGVGGDVSIIADLRADPRDTQEFRFSRSLLTQAASGVVALLSSGTARNTSQSIAEMSIHSALCAPVTLAGSVVAFLYLDARGRESAVQSDAAGFCQALAHAYGSMLAEAKRAELQHRQEKLTIEMAAAREVQSLILPPPAGIVGPVAYAAKVDPGLLVAGDLLDIFELDDGRTAVVMGDAAGHGIGSAMLMVAVQSHLHAELRRTGDPASAVAAANRYAADRAAGGRFVSAWVGVFDRAGNVEYVDAGHGHWMIKPESGAVRPGAGASAAPLGIVPDVVYTASRFTLGPTDRLILYSDGLAEQRNPRGEQFGQGRMAAALETSRAPETDVSLLFDAIHAFADTTSLDDDATVASVRLA